MVGIRCLQVINMRRSASYAVLNSIQYMLVIAVQTTKLSSILQSFDSLIHLNPIVFSLLAVAISANGPN